MKRLHSLELSFRHFRRRIASCHHLHCIRHSNRPLLFSNRRSLDSTRSLPNNHSVEVTSCPEHTFTFGSYPACPACEMHPRSLARSPPLTSECVCERVTNQKRPRPVRTPTQVELTLSLRPAIKIRAQPSSRPVSLLFSIYPFSLL